MVSEEVLNFLMEISVLSFVFPMVILLAWKMRTRKSILPAFAGILVFLAFAKLLESIPYAFFLGMTNPVSKVLRANSMLYALYVGIAAAVFEELGRYLVFRYFLNRYDERQTAITYGIGHGGIEIMLALGWSYLQYYVAATVFNQKGEEASLPSAIQTYLTGLTPVDCILEAVSAVLLYVLQIALSVLVFQAFRNQALRRRLIIIAMLLHTVIYLPNGFYEAGILPHVVSVLLELLPVGFGCVLARDIYKKMGKNEEKKQREKKKKQSGTDANVWNVASKKLSNIEEKK